MAHILYTKLLHGKKIDTCFPSKIQKPKKKKKRGERGLHFTFGLCRLETRFRPLSSGLGLHAMLGFHFP